MDNFFDFLRDNLDGLNSIPSHQRSNTFHETPNVLQIPAGASGTGSGMRRLQALRPLRPAGHIRSYNRRSFVESEEYPGANNHDPGLLWTGLGRR
ncbi:hypothetical protein RR46_14464 [Papilio xuthus]|nr:hypothetical protein RR46_14464 [Papilio xuthus]